MAGAGEHSLMRVIYTVMLTCAVMLAGAHAGSGTSPLDQQGQSSPHNATS